MVDSLMGGNTQMYYLNGRIDYRGLSPKDVNTELYRPPVHSYINRDSTLNMSKTLQTKISRAFVNKRSGKEERSLIGGCREPGSRAPVVTGGK